ncbi:hypothetical protein ebA5684 [Aromatoleum aromaticum EbN1]|uniref:Uncharacterized protein n=1 Tax=Aromatoleum aromaticum (strain DSM 19018 / LMG 30748 / EbN1) TaxID=76114 RepID=Q5P008_AROAE|nr:hypothetical protein ebA5684 [Aromatoleum aromaticum EbN1]
MIIIDRRLINNLECDDPFNERAEALLKPSRHTPPTATASEKMTTPPACVRHGVCDE